MSGGGGWGDKAGLLSLDPDTSHFPPSEEEALKNLFGSGGSSDFAPAGSEVQFFIHERWLDQDGDSHRQPEDDSRFSQHVFGVSEDVPEVSSSSTETDIVLKPNVFGALSDEAIYVSDKHNDDFKLSVPGARLGLS